MEFYGDTISHLMKIVDACHISHTISSAKVLNLEYRKKLNNRIKLISQSFLDNMDEKSQSIGYLEPLLTLILFRVYI